MIKSLKNFGWKTLNKMHLGGIVQLVLRSALLDDGWFNSFHKKDSIDKNGRPIPWFTYSSIKFLEKRLSKGFKVFEYGCGNSTIWFAERVHHIISIEHEKIWMEKVLSKLPVNAKVFHQELNSNFDYAKSIDRFNQKFDIVIIDGRERNQCAKYCVDYLTEVGIIIFDNTQENDYKDGINFLLSKGFRQIEFEGILPIVSYNNNTSIFYKHNNCFNI